MRHIDFDPAAHADLDAAVWARWEKRAGNATKEVRAWFDARAKPQPHGSPLPAAPPLDEAIWSDLKKILLEKVFRGRCAFCEMNVEVGEFGDGEHYRPKRAVKAVDQHGKMSPITVGTEPHVGYPWLAYDWRNIVPACGKCNGRKANQFPVAKAHCVSPTNGCTTTEELNAYECPLLLHPYFDTPGEHLTFGEDGSVASKSPRGAATVIVCDLRREALSNARAKEQRDAWRRVKELRSQGRTPTEAIKEILARCDAGDEDFSAAIADHLCARLAEHIAQLKADIAQAKAEHAAAEKLLSTRP